MEEDDPVEFLAKYFGSGGSKSRLDDLMTRLAQDPNPDLEEEFFNALLAGSVRVASPSLESQGLPIGERTAGEGAEVRFIGTTDPQGRRAMLAFTGDEAVRAWRNAGCDTIELPFPEACRLALSAKMESILINSGSRNCCLVAKADLEEFARGRAPVPPGKCRVENLQDGSIVLSRPPQAPPKELCDALAAEAAGHKAVAAVYLAAAAVGGAPAGPVAAVCLDPGTDPDGVIPAFLSGATVRLGGRAICDALPIVGGGALRRDADLHGFKVYSRP